jgi:hypothetical protein
MYGLVNKAVEDLVVTRFGQEKWEAIKAKAGVEVDSFISNESYPDSVTYDLVGAAAEVLEAPAKDILIAFGEHWVLETAAKSYGAMLKAGGRDLREFLINLPNFHTRVMMIFRNLKPPRFECTGVGEESLNLRYYTHREGLADFVVGLVQGLGKYYETPATCELIEARGENGECDVFRVTWTKPA